MGQQRLKRLKRLGIVILGAYVVSGCPSTTSSQLLGSSRLTREAIAQTSIDLDAHQQDAIVLTSPDTVEPTASTGPTVSFEVCAAVDSWQRPSEADQSKHLAENPRYAQALSSGALKASSAQLWEHPVISFTTYGLSARMEPENLSGLWSVSDDLQSCYEPASVMAINEGDRAEAWLLNQRITALQWQNDRYVMTVEPTPTGMQVVQFDRVDELASLPLEVVTTAGESVNVFSGDWQ